MSTDGKSIAAACFNCRWLLELRFRQVQVAPFPPPDVFGDLASLLFDATGGDLLSLFAQQQLLPTTLPPAPYRLQVGAAVSDPTNEVEIANFFGQVVASVPISRRNVPAPGTVALLGLGLLLLRRQLR